MSEYELEILSSVDGFDFSEWDDFVDESPQGCIFCRSWWLEAVCPKGFEILVLRRGGKIVAGMPMVRSHMLGLNGIVMPQLTQTLGVLLAPPTGQKYEKRLSSEMKVLKELVRAIPFFDYFNMNFHYNFTNWLAFYWAGYTQTTRYTYVLEKVSDLDELLANAASHVRTKIRKAERNGISVEETEDIEMFIELHRKTFARQGKNSPFDNEFIRGLDEACARHNSRKMLLAKDESNRVHTIAYAVYDNKCLYNLMQGSDPELRSSGAGLLALWHTIRLSQELNLRHDFEGSMIENIECVFRGFGARQTPYFKITKADLFAKLGLRLRSGVGRLVRRFRCWR